MLSRARLRREPWHGRARQGRGSGPPPPSSPSRGSIYALIWHRAATLTILIDVPAGHGVGRRGLAPRRPIGTHRSQAGFACQGLLRAPSSSRFPGASPRDERPVSHAPGGPSKPGPPCTSGGVGGLREVSSGVQLGPTAAHRRSDARRRRRRRPVDASTSRLAGPTRSTAARPRRPPPAHDDDPLEVRGGELHVVGDGNHR